MLLAFNDFPKILHSFHSLKIIYMKSNAFLDVEYSRVVCNSCSVAQTTVGKTSTISAKKTQIMEI